MALIIDTCNVLHRTGILPPELAGIDESGLVSLIGRSRYAGRQVILACDGRPRDPGFSPGSGTISVRFPGRGRSADDLIIDLIARSSSPKRLLVVSSDRQITSAARRRRSRTLDSDAFLAQLAQDVTARERSGDRRNEPRHPSPEAASAEAWLEHFEVDEGLRDLPASERPKRAEPAPETAGDTPPTPSKPPPSASEEWERLDTDELLRRYEGRRDGDDAGS